MLAYGLSDMLEWMECSLDDDEDENDYLPDEIERFANLTLEQKAWTVHLVAFGLLDRRTPIVPLTAYTEATVATIFRTIENMVQMEIDFVENLAENETVDGLYDVRRAIWTVHEEAGRNSADFIDDEPLKVECADIEQWKEAVHSIEFSILWDTDYAITTFEDGHPELDALKRARFTIDDNYFSAIPDDPRPAEAKRLMQEAQKLCDRVIKREEKKLRTR